MNYNEALTKNALLGELSTIGGLKAKAMTEKILLSIHYRRAGEEWMKARETVLGEKDATDEVKEEALQAKLMEDCGLEDRRMSVAAFEQVVEAAVARETMPSFLAGGPAPDSPELPQIPTAAWLQTFAELLVKD